MDWILFCVFCIGVFLCIPSTEILRHELIFEQGGFGLVFTILNEDGLVYI